MIVKLPDEILLWIFDFYRQSFRHLPSSERDWNNKNGWFKLAHVCRNWRSIVLSSPSRLRMRLYFADKTPTIAAVLTRLPPLPIVVDYLSHDIVWTASAQNRLTCALRYPSRVSKISIRATRENCDTIFKALDARYPILESFEIDHSSAWMWRFQANLPSTFLLTSMKSLRQLKIFSTRLALLPPLLSATAALVDLTLCVDRVVHPQAGVSLLPLLQSLPCLRRLDLKTFFYPHTTAIQGSEPQMKINDMVSLAELTSFRFEGHSLPIEEFVAKLATPSLQELHVSLWPGYRMNEFYIPQLSKFVRNAGINFFAAQVKFSQRNWDLSLLPHPNFIDEPPINFIGHGLSSIARIASPLSSILATVEDIFIAFLPSNTYAGSFQVDLTPLLGFSEQLQNVKVLRIQHGLETEVADMFRQDNVEPTMNLLPVQEPVAEENVNVDTTTPSDGPISPRKLGFLPSLERIEIHRKFPDTPIPESGCASALEPLGAFFATRQQAGRTVKACWNADQVLPESFYDGKGGFRW